MGHHGQGSLGGGVGCHSGILAAGGGDRTPLSASHGLWTGLSWFPPGGDTASVPHSGLTVDELAERAGLTVRTVRFYSSRGLLPPPAIGPRRVGLYGPEHLSRLALVQELRHRGMTLAAVERYLRQLPDDIGEHDLAIHRALVASWLPEDVAELDREKLEDRAGRPLGDGDVERLAAMGVLERTADPDTFRVDAGTLHMGVRLLDAPVPVEAVLAAREVMLAHSRAAASEIGRIFRREVWEPHREGPGGAAQVRALSRQMQPLVVQALVTAFQRALAEEVRSWPGAVRGGGESVGSAEEERDGADG
jgi:DNA-binding transcriptional MerR regulator